MAFIDNFTGFETGPEAFIIESAGATSGTAAVQSTVKRTGTYAFQTNPVTAAVGLVTFGTVLGTTGAPTAINAAVYYVSFGFRYGTKPAANSEEIFIFGGSNIYVRINSTGTLSLYLSTTLLATGLIVLVQDTFYRIEVKADNTNNLAALKVNGVIDIPDTAAAIAANNNGIGFGKINNRNSQTVNFYFDDCAWGDQGWIGSGEVLHSVPIGAGAAAGWTNGTSSIFSAVNQIPSDGDTTYIQASAAQDNTNSTFNMQSAATLAIAGRPILIVKAAVLYRAGAITGGTVRLRILSGGTAFNSSDLVNAGTGYQLLSRVMPTNPNGGDPWTVTAFDSLEVGMSSGTISQVQRFTVAFLSVWLMDIAEAVAAGQLGSAQPEFDRIGVVPY